MYMLKGEISTKIVGAAEFKAKCLKLIDDMQTSGEPLTIAKRGKPVATVSAIRSEKPLHTPLFGVLKSPLYSFDDPFTPATDMAQWEANNATELYRRK